MTRNHSLTLGTATWHCVQWPVLRRNPTV